MARSKKPRQEQVSRSMSPQDAWAALAEYARRTGQKRSWFIERLVIWFAAQPDPVKVAVTRGPTEGMEEEYAAVLEHLAAEVRRGKADATGRAR